MEITNEHTATGGNSVEVTGKRSKIKIEGADIVALGGAEQSQVKGALGEFATFLESASCTSDLSALGITSAQLLDVLQLKVSEALDVVMALKQPVNSQAEINGKNELTKWVQGLQRTLEPGPAPIYKPPIVREHIVTTGHLPPVRK